MNKKECKIVQQLRDLEANVPPQIRNLRWFWSFQDLMAKFEPTDPLHDPALEVTPEKALELQARAREEQKGIEEEGVEGKTVEVVEGLIDAGELPQHPLEAEAAEGEAKEEDQKAQQDPED